MRIIPKDSRRTIAAMLAVLTLLLTPCFRVAAAAKAPLWEVVTVSDPSPDEPLTAANVEASPRVDVTVHDGKIYINNTAPTQVKVEVYSILGQMVTQRNVPTGTMRLTLANKGIYIVKVAGTTRRINL